MQEVFNAEFIPDAGAVTSATQATSTTYNGRLNEYGLYDYTKTITTIYNPYRDGAYYELDMDAGKPTRQRN